jgi:D-aminopeptidase
MQRTVWVAVTIIVGGLGVASQGRPRARDLGIAPGAGNPGALNAITDVAGVKVGHVSLVQGETVRTGVTAILPHGGNVFREKVPGAVFVGNAFGKLAGSTQVEELGTIETPIVLTNTLSVGTAVEGVVRWTLDQDGNTNVRSVNALVGETNDGGLNDIRGMHVTRDHVMTAIKNSAGGVVDEGAIGAGTGTVAFGWKGGIGTSSRLVRRSPNEPVGQEPTNWTIGVLVQTNFGGRLTIAGVPVWRELTPRGGRGGAERASDSERVTRPPSRGVVSANAASERAGEFEGRGPSNDHDGSCMIVVATDAPLDARDLKRLAARAVYALARTGSTYSNGSGDFAIAFSTNAANRLTATNGPQPRSVLPTDAVSGLFEAALDATEEAVYNSLLKAVDTTSNGQTVRALPIEELKAVLKKYGR